VHTFAKARLTIAAVLRISMSSRFMSVNNHFPYLPVVTNPKKNNPFIQSPDGDPDRHRNLIVCSLAHCHPSLKISCKSVRTRVLTAFVYKRRKKAVRLASVSEKKPRISEGSVATRFTCGAVFNGDFVKIYCLQCFDAVGWVAGRASSL